MHDVDDPEAADEFMEDSEYDSRTPLDKTIDRIGMGAQSILASYFTLNPRLAPRELPVDTTVAMWIR